MKTLVVGLGNPIMGDDGIGCACARAVKLALEPNSHPEIEIDQFYRGGISLMERLIGYDRVLIIDSITGYRKKPGEIISLSLNDLPSQTTNSPHDGSLKNAIAFGAQLGEPLPEVVDILAIEVIPTFEFSETLTPPVAASIPFVVEFALKWIESISRVNQIDLKNSHEHISLEDRFVG